MRKIPTKTELTESLDKALETHYGRDWNEAMRVEIEHEVRAFLNVAGVDPKSLWVYIDDDGIVCVNSSNYAKVDTAKN